MNNNTYVSKVEENLRYQAEYLKNLKTISYDDIGKLLKDDNNFYQIHFYDQYDIINDIHYSCVNVLENNDTSKQEEYKTIDQDPKDVYNNIIMLLSKNKDMKPRFQIIINYDNSQDLVCNTITDIIIFPKTIVRDLIENANEYSNKKPGDVYCIYRSKELFLPSQFEKEVNKESVKIK